MVNITTENVIFGVLIYFCNNKSFTFLLLCTRKFCQSFVTYFAFRTFETRFFTIRNRYTIGAVERLVGCEIVQRRELDATHAADKLLRILSGILNHIYGLRNGTRILLGQRRLWRGCRLRGRRSDGTSFRIIIIRLLRRFLHLSRRTIVLLMCHIVFIFAKTDAAIFALPRS